MTTDPVESFDPPSMISYAGFHMAQAAANKVYEKAGVNPKDIRVAELHDCFAQNELLSYEALGLCGGRGREVRDGRRQHLRRPRVTNPSGGLLSKGHPLGATGLAQCYELTHQLRGTADKRQVEGAKLALQHNIGLGGACVVTLYGKA
jgi:acetyl-CoA acetyltransferase